MTSVPVFFIAFYVVIVTDDFTDVTVIKYKNKINLCIFSLFLIGNTFALTLYGVSAYFVKAGRCHGKYRYKIFTLFLCKAYSNASTAVCRSKLKGCSFTKQIIFHIMRLQYRIWRTESRPTTP